MKKPNPPHRSAPSRDKGPDETPSRRPAKSISTRARPASPPRSETTVEGGSDKLAKIAGLPAVSALFRRDPERAMRLYYSDAMARAAGPFCARLAQMRRPYRLVDEGELERVAGTVLHGGIVAAALPQSIADLDGETLRRWARSHEPLLILDGVGNPHNLGAIARTLAFFGLRHLLVSDHPAQAGLSDATYRVAEGGLEFLEIRRAPNLPQWLKRLGEHYRVVGTALGRKAVPLYQLRNTDKPLALVMGNEEAGLPKETLAACEAVTQVQGSGWVQSLNVSATAAILIHELSRQRRPRS